MPTQNSYNQTTVLEADIATDSADDQDGKAGIDIGSSKRLAWEVKNVGANPITALTYSESVDGEDFVPVADVNTAIAAYLPLAALAFLPPLGERHNASMRAKWTATSHLGTSVRIKVRGT